MMNNSKAIFNTYINHHYIKPATNIIANNNLACTRNEGSPVKLDQYTITEKNFKTKTSRILKSSRKFDELTTSTSSITKKESKEPLSLSGQTSDERYLMKNPFVVLVGIENYEAKDWENLEGVAGDIFDMAHLWIDIYVSIVFSPHHLNNVQGFARREVSDIYTKYSENLGYPDDDDDDNKNNGDLIDICDKILSNKQEFNDYLIKIRKKIENGNYDGLIFYYSGDGENDEIILRNGSSLDIKKGIASKFRNDECIQLRGTPKTFLFDTCRLLKSENETEKVKHRSKKRTTNKSLHPWSGFTFAHANYKGYIVKDFRTGGIFTQAVRNVFEKPEKIEDKSLNELLVEVRKETNRLAEKRNVCQLVTFEDAGLPVAVYFCQRQNTKSKFNCNTIQHCECNLTFANSNTTINNNNSQKQTEYKKLTNLSKKEIDTIFFGVNGIDPNFYQIKSVDEIDETQENNGLEAKETKRWLWHGTNVQVVDKILANGFNRNYNTMAAYGIGVYFARDSSYNRCYCEKYDKKTHNGDLCMLLCKVIVGDVTKGRYTLRKIQHKS